MDKTISLCMIVKDEEENIDRIFSNIYSLFNEIIILDIGSTDKTIEKLEKYTNNIYKYNFNNNFAELKNYLISKAKSEYIFILEPDEEIKREYIIKLREILNFHIDRDVYFINIIDYINNIKSQELQARLFRNISTIKYKYSVFENIHNSIEDNNLTYICLDNISVNNFKYENIEKSRLYFYNLIQILEKELSNKLDIEEETYYILRLINIYSAYYFIGFEIIVELISKYFEITKNNILKDSKLIPKNLFFNTYLLAMIYSKGDFHRIEEISKNIYSFYPNSLNILFYLFISSLNMKKIEEAKKYANKLKSLILNKTYFKFEPLILEYINKQINEFISSINQNFKFIEENLKIKKINYNKKISLCVICMDNNINNKLEKIFYLFDEIIIVSTGKLINEYNRENIKIYNIEFNNDISELKNFALSIAKNEYLLYLNSYEYINSGDIESFNEYIYNSILFALNINVLEYNDDNDLIDIKQEIRFFKNNKNIIFNNRIFENPDFSIYSEINKNSLSIQSPQSINILKIFSIEREKNKLKLINNIIDNEEDLLHKIYLYYKKFLIEEYFNYNNTYYSLFEAFKLLENKNFEILPFNKNLSEFLLYIANFSINNKDILIDIYNKNISLFPIEYKSYLKIGELFFKEKNIVNAKVYLNKAIEIINTNPIFNENKPKYLIDDLLKIDDIFKDIDNKKSISLIINGLEDDRKYYYKDKFENIFFIKSIKDILDIQSNFFYFLFLKDNEEIIFDIDNIKIDNTKKNLLIKIEYENLIWYEKRLLSLDFINNNNINIENFIIDEKINNDKIENLKIKTSKNPYYISDSFYFDKLNINSLIYYEKLMSKYLNDNNIEEFDNIFNLFNDFDNIPSIFYNNGIRLLNNENYKEAIKNFHRCIELGNDGDFYPYIPFDEGILNYLSMYNIGLCYLKQNKNQLAKIFFEQSLEENENFDKAREELNKLSN